MRGAEDRGRPDRELSLKEAAELTGCPGKTLRRHIRDGRLEPASIDGNKLTVTLSGLREAGLIHDASPRAATPSASAPVPAPAAAPAPVQGRGVETPGAERNANDRAERDRVERSRRERERSDRERAERDRAERSRAEREKSEREKAENAKADQERAERLEADRERVERERAESERADAMRRERAEREKAILLREEKERAERQRADRERAEKERAERTLRERSEQEKADRERTERERRDREKAERDRLERERGERLHREREKSDLSRRERVEAERTDKERVEREKAVRESAAREKAEREKADALRAEREKAERENAERERLEGAKANAEREKADAQRADRERADAERARKAAAKSKGRKKGGGAVIEQDGQVVFVRPIRNAQDEAAAASDVVEEADDLDDLRDNGEEPPHQGELEGLADVDPARDEDLALASPTQPADAVEPPEELEAVEATDETSGREDMRAVAPADVAHEAAADAEPHDASSDSGVAPDDAEAPREDGDDEEVRLPPSIEPDAASTPGQPVEVLSQGQMGERNFPMVAGQLGPWITAAQIHEMLRHLTSERESRSGEWADRTESLYREMIEGQRVRIEQLETGNRTLNDQLQDALRMVPKGVDLETIETHNRDLRIELDRRDAARNALEAERDRLRDLVDRLKNELSRSEKRNLDLAETVRRMRARGFWDRLIGSEPGG